jgi:outer membrane lipoprotein
MKARKLLLATVVPLLIGCAPVISRNVLKDVNESVDFQVVVENPDKYRGETILLGGDIIETQPLPNKTVIIVLQRPLEFGDKPTSGVVSQGRFIVEAPGFLDPAIYSQGRKVTLVGSVSGKEERPLGNTSYVYPIIASKELYLWPMEEPWDRPRFIFGLGIGKTF